MKACLRCGAEIDTRDGQNKCGKCEDGAIKKNVAKRNRMAIKDAMESLGMKRVRGAMGEARCRA